jgi:cytochrome c
MARPLIRQATIPAILILAGALLAAAPAAAGDARRGEAVYAAKCALCHTTALGGPTVLGPNLFGVVGRKAGADASFSYSRAMKSAGFTWSRRRLRTYLSAPGKVVPGTRMTYVSLKSRSQRNDLIAYLDTLK